MLTNKEVQDFQELHKKNFDTEISFEEASKRARGFIGFLENLFKNNFNSH